MSTTTKSVIAIVVVLIVAAGGYYWYTHQSSGVATTAGVSTASTSQATPGQLPGGSSDSDAALSEDTAAIDAQLQGLDSDNANLNAAQNDQPISQQ